MRTDIVKALRVPAFGRIKGGQLDGWFFHFLHFRAAPRSLRLVARCTPPAWPFPCDIHLAHQHFSQLRAIPGSRAKRIEVRPLIAQAYALAGLDAPAWATHTSTIRSAIARSNVGRTYPKGKTP
jgi:hypothetical protein